VKRDPRGCGTRVAIDESISVECDGGTGEETLWLSTPTDRRPMRASQVTCWRTSTRLAA
jgi:hypothetical protein